MSIYVIIVMVSITEVPNIHSKDYHIFCLIWRYLYIRVLSDFYIVALI